MELQYGVYGEDNKGFSCSLVDGDKTYIDIKIADMSELDGIITRKELCEFFENIGNKIYHFGEDDSEVHGE